MPALTLGEARAIYSALRDAWVPNHGYLEFRSGLAKLSAGGMSCRDCSQRGLYPHRLGGLVCADHQPPTQEKKP